MYYVFSLPLCFVLVWLFVVDFVAFVVRTSEYKILEIIPDRENCELNEYGPCWARELSVRDVWGFDCARTRLCVMKFMCLAGSA